MSKDGNIEDWYKGELSNFEANPDADGWESISSQLDNDAILTDENVGEWYVQELEKFQTAPDKEVWSKLSTKLDVTSVWDKLLVSLNQYDRMIWWRNTAFKSAALLLLFIGGYYTYTNIGGEESNNKFIVSQSILGENGTTKNNTIGFEKAKNNLNAKQSSSVVDEKEFSNASFSTAPKLTTIVTRKAEPKAKRSNNNNEMLVASMATKVEKIQSLKVRELGGNYSILPLIYNTKAPVNLEAKTINSKEFLVKKDQNKIIFNSKRFSSHFVFGMYARRLYFGVNGGVKYQTLFASSKQNEAFSNFTKKQLMDFGGSFGATVGLIVSDKFNLEANVNVLSTSGNKHEYSSYNNSLIQEVNLQYSTVSLLAKKMNNKSTFDNKKYSTNYIGGLYAGFLTAAENNIDGNIVDMKSQYSNIDLGIVLGIEQDRYITKELVVTPGVRFYQGLLNTSNQSNELMNSSRNFSVEFNIGLKYIFLKKN